jgi:hypothetical protein
MKKLLLFVMSLTVSASLSASTIGFSAGVANNISGIGGADLAASVQVSAGIWDGVSFTSLSSGDNANLGAGSGFFSHSSGKLDTASSAGSQLAFSWTDGGTTAIIYYDITSASADAGSVDNWSLAGGDGGGTDFFTNNIDVVDLTVGGSGTTLNSSAVLINAAFGGTNALGTPTFSIAVPEPSSYALLGGLFALTFVMLRRRA